MSLEKWRIEEGRILCNMDSLQCSVNCLQFNLDTIVWSGFLGLGYYKRYNLFYLKQESFTVPW